MLCIKHGKISANYNNFDNNPHVSQDPDDNFTSAPYDLYEGKASRLEADCGKLYKL